MKICARRKWTLSNAKLQSIGTRDEETSYPERTIKSVMRGGYLYVMAYNKKGIYKINVEELDIREKEDVDEKIVENAIIHNIKNFILTFGKDFAFIRNQYHLDAFGEDQYIDLLFFNRECRTARVLYITMKSRLQA